MIALRVLFCPRITTIVIQLAYALSIEFIGNDSTQRTYTESYVDGIYNLTITHNGRVKVTLT